MKLDDNLNLTHLKYLTATHSILEYQELLIMTVRLIYAIQSPLSMKRTVWNEESKPEGGTVHMEGHSLSMSEF